MRYLGIEEVLFLHWGAVEEYGGGHGLRDRGLLESAVANPRQTFGGRDLYPDLWLKAGVLARGIIKNHPFMDGNKRTGMISAGTFLELNGYRLETSQAGIVEVAVRIANESPPVEVIAEWFRSHSEPAPGW